MNVLRRKIAKLICWVEWWNNSKFFSLKLEKGNLASFFVKKCKGVRKKRKYHRLVMSRKGRLAYFSNKC